MSADPSTPKSGHSRHDTALIHGLSTTEVSRLSEAAIGAKAKAYCPYSNFHVGCGILLTDGNIVQGGNVENASYPVGHCAEQVAIATAVIQGAKRGDFRAIAVASDITPPASPCGMCRQFLQEFCLPNTPILMYDKDAKCTVMTLGQLLPMAFGPRDNEQATPTTPK